MHAYAATHTENDRNHWIQEISLDLNLGLKTPTSEPRSPQDPTPQPSSSHTTTGPSGLTMEVSPSPGAAPYAGQGFSALKGTF